MNQKKRLLLVAYYAPPNGAVGAVRITKFTKYLLRLGWNVTIVTVKSNYSTLVNEKWLEDIDGAKVIRTQIANIKMPGLSEHGYYWRADLKKALKEELDQYSYDISLWTGGPFMHWNIAKWMKNKYKLNYILDFRDPWFLSPYAKNSLLSHIRAIVFKRIESKAIHDSVGIINVTEEATKLYTDYYSNISKEKFFTIYNGYDIEDFKGVEKVPRESISIIYTGKFGHFRDPLPFLKSFKKYISDKDISTREIQLTWIGAPEEHVIEMINDLQLNGYVEVKGFMPYSEVLKEIAKASHGLLISGNHAFEPTTKIFDYLALNIPIIALVNTEGFLTRTLANVSGALVKKNIEEDIYQVIDFIYSKRSKVPSIEKTPSNDRFNREEHAKQLNEILLQNIFDKPNRKY